jgi:Na+/melibiose symporter-like transporter
MTDLVAGYLVDNTHTKLGKARPYEFAIIGVWISTLLLFYCPASLSLTAKCIWIFCMYSLTYSIFATLLYAAQQPYIIRAFGSREMVIKVSSFGGIVSTLGSAAVSVFFPILMAKMVYDPSGNPLAASTWHVLVMIFAVPLCLIGLLRLIFVKEIYQPEGEEKKNEKVELKSILRMLRKNRYVWDIGVIVGMIQVVLGMSAATYYFTFIVGDISKYSQLQAMTIIMLGLMFIFPVLMKKMSVGGLVILGSVIGLAGYIVNFFAGSSMVMLMVAFFATGFSQLPGSYLQAPMLMEASAYNEYIGLPRMDSTSASVMNFMSKFFNAIGAGLLGVVLQAAGFVSSNGSQAVTQPESAIFMIRLLYSVVPAVFMIFSIIAAKHFEGLSKQMPEITKVLEERKKEV